jgi:hypothetical protein
MKILELMCAYSKISWIIKKIPVTLPIFALVLFTTVNAQYTTDKVIGKKNDVLRDSLKKTEYPYLLPIWGEKIAKKGFSLPYSAGVSVQYLTQQSDIIINNLQVGFNNGPMYNMDELVRFDQARATSNGINIRPDIWLFPFLNIYGILAKSNTSTAIKAGIWIPDSTSWKKIMDIDTKANFKATTYGFGFTPTVGVGGFFLATDMNVTWTDIDELNKPAFAFIFDPRIGKNFSFKNKNRSLAVWVGGFRLKLNSGTSGSLNTGDLFPTDQWQSKIDTGYMKVANSQQQVDEWWSNLTPTEQKNPVNIAKYETANSALQTAGNILNAASQVVTNAGNSSVQYSLDKRPKNMWNFLIGSQFQINKSWMIRAEYGFLGTRQQFVGGLQYRFNL